LCDSKKINKKIIQYGFISTGNLNEKTAKIYADHCLLTSSRTILTEANKVFTYLENWHAGIKPISKSRNLLISPTNMRSSIVKLIDNEIKFAKQGKIGKISIKLNSLSDQILLRPPLQGSQRRS
jgi:polyphosphate kinase